MTDQGPVCMKTKQAEYFRSLDPKRESIDRGCGPNPRRCTEGHRPRSRQRARRAAHHTSEESKGGGRDQRGNRRTGKQMQRMHRAIKEPAEQSLARWV
jgi:hypothetical protein